MKRRDFVSGAAAVAAGVVAAGGGAVDAQDRTDASRATASGPRTRLHPDDSRYRPVVTPNVSALPWHRVGDAKVFHLVAEDVRNTFCPGLEANCWGYNGSTPGPTIEAVEGDLLRIYVTNRLREPTTVHWHGLTLPSGMDGVGGLSQHPIEPGETFRYEFTVQHPGTFMYHPHWDEMTQMAMGMMGMFIVHPRRPRGRQPDRDFVIMLSEWGIPIGASTPNPLEMTDFNVLTMNSKCFPGTEALVAQRGDLVRIRFGNLSGMDNHPIHLHGYSFDISGSDGGEFPRSARQPATTVIVPTGSCRTIEFVADAPGDWAMHCHMNHHVMNQMGHEAPNMLGVDARQFDRRVRALVPGYMTMGQTGMAAMGDMDMPVPDNSVPMRGGPGAFGNIDMGGMFTILKVRDELGSYDDPGWFENPAGTRARVATAEELAADGIELERGS